MHVSELETPSILVDLDILEANILRLQSYLSQHGLANRPHVKTHKIPAIAHLQINAGAVGITCQKLGEAEVMAEAGIKDIFLPYNLIGAAKLGRLMNLARRKVRMSVTADAEIVVRGLSAAAQGAGLTLPVLVECDTGAKRCGVQSPEAAAALARLIARSPGLHFGGFMTYPNSEQLDPFMREAKRLLVEHGLSVECVSGGGTPQMWQAHTHRELTEHRAGMYLYGDRYTLRSGAMQLADCSFKVRATVVSRPTPDRAIIDSGSKTLSSDVLGLDGHGLITEYPEAQLYSLSEEHGHVDLARCASKPEIGEPVTIIPNHCCVVSNLANEVVGVRQGEVEVIWPVAARGRVQ
jgi:D-serine deaminase-like pyridoxal phosphate-dependent protein